MLGRRFQSFHCRFQTCVEFDPRSFQQMAGLICFYDDHDYYYAHVSFDEEVGRCLGVLECKLDKLADPIGHPVPIGPGPVHLRAEYHETRLSFSYSLDGETWTPLVEDLDATVLSDEHTVFGLGFTGAFGALCAHDLTGSRAAADFDYFEYVDLTDGPA
jgi:xylan 1,4-beta-xylosidase